MAKLYAIADLHISHRQNLDAFQLLRPHPDDSLIIAGDVGEKLEHLRTAFSLTTKLFKQVFWVPGNHELYTLPKPAASEDDLSSIYGAAPDPEELKGELRYFECIRVANEYGVITPDDEYVTWDNGEGTRAVICPIFTLYDYSFRPDNISREQALDWAMEEGIKATDEVLLHPDPYETRDAWCDILIKKTEARLEKAAKESDLPLIIINHWPLREDLVGIPSIPRFSLWCGSKKTNDWHKRFNAKVVVTGHLHVRRTDWIDDTRFEEVSLGYPRQWEAARERGKGVNEMLREILPGISGPPSDTKTIFRRLG